MSDIEDSGCFGNLDFAVFGYALFQKDAVDIKYFVGRGFVESFNKERFMVHAG